jgi:hypothetical protein
LPDQILTDIGLVKDVADDPDRQQQQGRKGQQQIEAELGRLPGARLPVKGDTCIPDDGPDPA